MPTTQAATTAAPTTQAPTTPMPTTQAATTAVPPTTLGLASYQWEWARTTDTDNPTTYTVEGRFTVSLDRLSPEQRAGTASITQGDVVTHTLMLSSNDINFPFNHTVNLTEPPTLDDNSNNVGSVEHRFECLLGDPLTFSPPPLEFRLVTDTSQHYGLTGTRMGSEIEWRFRAGQSADYAVVDKDLLGQPYIVTTMPVMTTAMTPMTTAGGPTIEWGMVQVAENVFGDLEYVNRAMNADTGYVDIDPAERNNIDAVTASRLLVLLSPSDTVEGDFQTVMVTVTGTAASNTYMVSFDNGANFMVPTGPTAQYSYSLDHLSLATSGLFIRLAPRQPGDAELLAGTIVLTLVGVETEGWQIGARSIVTINLPAVEAIPAPTTPRLNTTDGRPVVSLSQAVRRVFNFTSEEWEPTILDSTALAFTVGNRNYAGDSNSPTIELELTYPGDSGVNDFPIFYEIAGSATVGEDYRIGGSSSRIDQTNQYSLSLQGGPFFNGPVIAIVPRSPGAAAQPEETIIITLLEVTAGQAEAAPADQGVQAYQVVGNKIFTITLPAVDAIQPTPTTTPAPTTVDPRLLSPVIIEFAASAYTAAEGDTTNVVIQRTADSGKAAIKFILNAGSSGVADTDYTIDRSGLVGEATPVGAGAANIELPAWVDSVTYPVTWVSNDTTGTKLLEFILSKAGLSTEAEGVTVSLAGDVDMLSTIITATYT